MDIEARRWLKPRKLEFRNNKPRVESFKKMYNKYDWTSMIGGR